MARSSWSPSARGCGGVRSARRVAPVGRPPNTWSIGSRRTPRPTARRASHAGRRRPGHPPPRRTPRSPRNGSAARRRARGRLQRSHSPAQRLCGAPASATGVPCRARRPRTHPVGHAGPATSATTPGTRVTFDQPSAAKAAGLLPWRVSTSRCSAAAPVVDREQMPIGQGEHGVDPAGGVTPRDQSAGGTVSRVSSVAIA